MAKLSALTAAQAALLPGIRDEWLGHGLATGPADRGAAEEGVRAAYRAAGLEPPRFMIWLDSPSAGAFGQAYAAALFQALAKSGQVRDQVWGQVRDQVRDQVLGQVLGQVRDQVRDQVLGQVLGQVRDQVWGQVRDQVLGQVRDQVWGQVRDQVLGQVRDQVWGQVRDQVRDQVWGQVRDQVLGQVRDQVWGQVRDQVLGQVSDQVRDQVLGQVSDQVSDQVRDQVSGQVRNWYAACVYGQHDAGWLAFYAAMQQLGVQKVDAIQGLQQVARNTGWWWAFRGYAILTERPTELHRDKDGRLHNPHGPAITYPDGWGIHAWHGTRTPADLIEKGWTVPRILAETNTEIRRCAIERDGWPTFIAKGDFTQVGDTVPDPGNDGQVLKLYDLPKQLRDTFSEPARILVATNGSPERDGTRHMFGLVVPAHHDDPLSAAADTYDLPVEVYAQLQVRR